MLVAEGIIIKTVTLQSGHPAMHVPAVPLLTVEEARTAQRRRN
jgi:hypothetical protein